MAQPGTTDHEDDGILTAEQKRAYFAAHCRRCPHCKSEDIAGTGNNNSDGNWHTETIRCISCHAQWDDHYTITGVEGTEEPHEE